jgi:CspA family cold shock protein
MPTGKIKLFNAERGFGFIVPDTGGAAIFFHVSALAAGADVHPGNAVSFEIRANKRPGRARAVYVNLV